MQSAFGVEHGAVVKRETVPDWMTPALPGSTVVAYNNSSDQKVEAAGKNLGAKAVGGVTGSAVGLGAMLLAGKKVKALQKPTVLLARKAKHAKQVKPRLMLSAERKQGFAQASAMGSSGGIGGTYAGNRSLQDIKRDKQYGYRRAS